MTTVLDATKDVEATQLPVGNERLAVCRAVVNNKWWC